jgi:hypothetical protein
LNKETTQAWASGALGAAEGAWRYYKPELMWGAIGASVVAYDLLCKPGETLSDSADTAIESHPLLTRLAIGATALHLANLIPKPDKLDPIHIAFKKIKKL